MDNSVKTWGFYLLLDEPELTEDQCDALYDAGCDDATIVTREGITYLAFDREDESQEAAVGSAIASVTHAGLLVTQATLDCPHADKGM